MVDVITHERIVVQDEGTASPYLMVPEAQVQEVKAALLAHHVPCWMDEEAISIDGEPAVSVVNLGRDVDPSVVQRILDQL